LTGVSGLEIDILVEEEEEEEEGEADDQGGNEHGVEEPRFRRGPGEGLILLLRWFWNGLECVRS
jgi:hypothetical protein